MNKVAQNIMNFPVKSPYRPETSEAFLCETVAEDKQEALSALQAQGLPTPRLERWKYTNLIPAVKDFSLDQLKESHWDYKDAEGFITLQDSHVAAVPAGEAQYNDMTLWHLSNLHAQKEMLIHVPANHKVALPIEIDFTGHEGAFYLPRIVVKLEQGAELTIIEKHSGAGHFWNNQLIQISVGANARLHHYRVQDYSSEAVYTQDTHVTVDRDGLYEAFTLTVGAGLSRNHVHLDLVGENATGSLYGVNILRGKQHGDTTITIEHQAPHTNSNQFYRTVLDDRAHAVFQGKVHVHQIAQKTDGYQISKALLLSEGAEMDTKPELEIYADDVKCSHGATTGQLDEKALFYLRSRGIDEAQARGLLIKAFLQEAVDRIGDKSVENPVNNIIEERIQSWLGK